jgi:hypothetical protein
LRIATGAMTLLTKTQYDFLKRFVMEPPPSPTATGAEIDETRSAADLKAAGTAWEQAREAGSRALTRLISELLVEGDPALAEVAVLVGQLSSQLPSGLAAELDSIARQYQSGTADPVLPKGLAMARNYLEQNDAALARCEDNPLGISVDVRQPFTVALDHVERALNTLRSR